MSNTSLTENKADILIVDDTPENLRLLNQILSQYYKVRLAPSGTIGLSAAHSTPPDLILLDIMMPDLNGFEVAAKLKSDPLTADIPIVFMSALDDTESKVRGFKSGGIDYVTKPFQEMEVLARVRTHISIRTLYNQAQEEISERKRVESNLRESESRISALLSAVPDTMYRIRRDGVIQDYKTSSDELLFAKPENIIGSALKDLLDESLLNQFMESIIEVLETKSMKTMDYTQKIEDSSRVFEARFKDSGSDEVTVIIRDISGWVRLEQMKSDFINRASHELRTPIATMLLMANLIDSGTTPEEFIEYWDILKTEINNERMLIENLLNVGRMESGQIQLHFARVEVSKVIQKVIETLEHTASDKNITVSFNSLIKPETEEYIRGDENALTQVFVNLLGNAVKFTREGGNISIQLNQKNSGVEITFIDSGIGIPSADLPLLFTRFFRGSNAIDFEIPGTGIGLFFVHQIIEKHNGRIKVRSEIDKGSRFDVWLPFDDIQ